MALPDIETSLNTALGGRIQLVQPATGYRAAIDPVFLAASVRCGAGDHVLDLGTGVGTAALCLAARVEGVRVTGLELQPVLAELASKNACDNSLSANITIIEGDLRRRPFEAEKILFDHVMANPPYHKRGEGQVSPNAIKAIANIEGEGGLSAWIAAGVEVLKPGGSISIIHTAERLDDLLCEMRKVDAGGIEVFPLWPADGRRAKRVIVRAVKNGRGALTMHAGIVLHDENNEYSSAARSVLQDGAPLTI